MYCRVLTGVGKWHKKITLGTLLKVFMFYRSTCENVRWISFCILLIFLQLSARFSKSNSHVFLNDISFFWNFPNYWQTSLDTRGIFDLAACEKVSRICRTWWSERGRCCLIVYLGRGRAKFLAWGCVNLPRPIPQPANRNPPNQVKSNGSASVTVH